MQSLLHKKIFPGRNSGENESYSSGSSASYCDSYRGSSSLSGVKDLKGDSSDSGCRTGSSPYRHQSESLSTQERGEPLVSERQEAHPTLNCSSVGRLSPELSEFIESLYIEAADPDIYLKETSFWKGKAIKKQKRGDIPDSDKRFLLEDIVQQRPPTRNAKLVKNKGKFSNENLRCCEMGKMRNEAMNEVELKNWEFFLIRVRRNGG